MSLKLISSMMQRSFFISILGLWHPTSHLGVIGTFSSTFLGKFALHVFCRFFWVSLLYMSFAAFLSLFVFWLVWVLYASFLWILIVVCMHVIMYKHRFSFRLHLDVVACMTLFLHLQQPISHTCMFSHFLNLEFAIFMHDHSLFLTLSFAMHSKLHMFPVTRQRVRTTLARALPCPKKIAHFWEGRLFLPPRKCIKLARHYPLGFLYKILRGSALLAHKIMQCSP